MNKPSDLNFLRGNLLVAELLGPTPTRVVRAARELRRRGVAGAAFAEILALLRFRQRIEAQEALRVCHSLRAIDWYDMSRPVEHVSPEIIIEAAYWVSNYELDVYAKHFDYDPARRIQELAILLSDLRRGVWNPHALTNVSQTERHAFACLTYIRNGQIPRAFQELYKGFQVDQSHIWIRRAANQLFYQVPRRQRAEVICYGASSFRNLGISPFPGHGLVLKEFTGFVDKITPNRTECAPLPLVKVVPLDGVIQFKHFSEELWKQLADPNELLLEVA